jgi:hypothetical protein
MIENSGRKRLEEEKKEKKVFASASPINLAIIIQ